MDSIFIYIQQDDLSFLPLEIPLGIELSLMEVLKGEGYERIEGICGGMALCGTCRIEVLNIDEVRLEGANDAELCMLDTLPLCDSGHCRLACQLHINENLNGLKIRIPQD